MGYLLSLLDTTQTPDTSEMLQCVKLTRELSVRPRVWETTYTSPKGMVGDQGGSFMKLAGRG